MTDTNLPGFSWPELRTPPAENSDAVGGPSAEDGQGVCTINLTITYPDFSTPAKFRGLAWADAGALVRSVARHNHAAKFDFVVCWS